MVLRKRGGYGEYDYDNRRMLAYSSSSDDDEVVSYLSNNFSKSSHSFSDDYPEVRSEKELVASALAAFQRAEENDDGEVQMDEEEWMAWSRHLAREEKKLKQKQAALSAARSRTMGSVPVPVAASVSNPTLSSSTKHAVKGRETTSSSYLPYKTSRSGTSSSTSSLPNYVDTPPLTPPTSAATSSRKKTTQRNVTPPYPDYSAPRNYATSTTSSRFRNDDDKSSRSSKSRRHGRRDHSDDDR